MNRIFCAVLGVLGTLCAALAGCSKKSEPKFDLVPVSGVVKLDGQPITEAAVAYYLEGSPPKGYFGSAANTDDQGHYELRTGDQSGAVPGVYKVTISRLAGKDGKPLVTQEGLDVGQLRRQGVAVESLPARYSDETQTELKTTVEKGKADGYNFDLKSG